mgnify:CR=1 FL=1
MKVTLFTSNNLRHLYLINLIAENCEKLYVIQENKLLKDNIIPENYKFNHLDNLKLYFGKVNDAQKKIFAHDDKNLNNVRKKTIKFGELNFLNFNDLTEYLNSDYYIVFGSSIIKNKLLNFLIKNKAVNIHAGVSPYYNGTDCNFWALYDDNPHLVGTTVQILDKNLDGGPIIYHAMSKLRTNPFEYSMSTVKSAFVSLSERIFNHSEKNYETLIQKNSKLIRKTRTSDFNETVLKEYLDKSIDLNLKDFEDNLLWKPFYLSE